MPFIERIEKRLSGWKGRHLSLGERITLINSVLSSLPTYIMSFYELPRWVIRRIDRLRRRFLWKGCNGEGRGIPLVNLGRICKKKEFGGLGVINLRDMNLALLCKWWWKLHHRRNISWRALFDKYRRRKRHKFGGTGCGRTSQLWKGIEKVGVIFHHNTRCIVGNGKETRFWVDKWCLGVTLANEFPRLFNIIGNKDESVANFWGRKGWRIRCPGPLTLEQSKEWERLIDLLRNWRVERERDDSREWELQSDRSFSVKSLYHWYNDGGMRGRFCKEIWQASVPHKVRAFLWFASNDAILSRVNLEKRKIPIEVVCGRCGKEDESTNHILFECDRARVIWEVICLSFGIEDIPREFGEIWGEWRNERVKREDEKMWDTALAATLWTLWMDRNNLYFKNIDVSCKSVVNNIMSLMHFWIGHGRAKKKLRVDDNEKEKEGANEEEQANEGGAAT